MSDVYKVATGHNVLEEDMTAVLQQPEVEPVQVVERHYGIDGTYYDEGLYVRYHFGVIESATLYQSILTQFGLVAATVAAVTVFARNDTLTWTKYNGYAHRPQPGVDAKWSRFFWQDIDIYVTDLVEVINEY